jgi:myo-inositol-1(or 4)-monophosphatase
MKISEVISPIIIEAGNIMLGAHDISKDIKEKPGSANYVTAYDVAVENFLIEKLSAAFPDAKFIGEEHESTHGKVEQKGRYFIIDPIDGTTNFIHGYRHSCISIALLEDGKVISGVVFNPYQNELFTADLGKGAFLNGEAIHVSERELSQALVIFGTSPYNPELFDVTIKTVESAYKNCRDVRRDGSAALNMAYIAAGRGDVYFEYVLSPWDYAAGYLLIKEAGGIVTDIDGNDVTFDKPSTMLASNISARNEFVKICLLSKN